MGHATIVRHEFFGPLIWSSTHNSYFIPRDEQDKLLTIKALNQRQSPAGWRDSLPDSFVNELSTFGFDGDMREITSPYTDRISGPLEVYFDYTWICNLAHNKCGQDSYCYAAQFLGPTTMPPERVRALMEELAAWGVMRVHLAGGEPTSRKKDLANYLDSASEFGLYTSMATNGLLINDEIIDIILRNSLKSVSFSLDGASEETHAKVRGRGLFAKTVRSIQRMIERRNAAHSQMRVCIKPTYEPSTPNQELERLVLLGIELGVDVVKFANPERCLHHEQGYYGRDVDLYYEKIAFIRELQRLYGDKVAITNVNNPLAGCGDIGLPGLQGCIGAQELLAINPDGSVTPCLMHSYRLGNILHEYSSLQEFWRNEEKLPAFWASLKKPAACQQCNMYSSCRSGSTTRRIVQVGRFNKDRTSGDFIGVRDPLCPRDYLARHPDVTKPVPLTEAFPFSHFREITVRHSL